MESRLDLDHKLNDVCAGHRHNSRDRILSVRSALILALAILTALIAAVIMKLNHRPDAQIGLDPPTIFAAVKPRPHDDHKHNVDCVGGRGRSLNRILSVRSALILALAILTALIAAVIMKLNHRPDVQILLAAPGIFAVATVFYDRVIDRH